MVSCRTRNGGTGSATSAPTGRGRSAGLSSRGGAVAAAARSRRRRARSSRNAVIRLPFVLALEQQRLRGDVERRGGGAVLTQRQLGQFQRPPGSVGDPVGQRDGLLQQAFRRMDRIDQAGGERLVGGQHLPDVEHPAGGLQPGGLREPPVRARAGHDAEPEFGLGEPGVRRGDPQVAGQGQFAAAAVGRPVDDGDARPAVRLEPVEQAGVDAAQRRVGVPVHHFGDVGAGREHPGVVECTISTHGSRRASISASVDLVDHGPVQGVVFVRTVQAEQENVAAAFGRGPDPWRRRGAAPGGRGPVTGRSPRSPCR